MTTRFYGGQRASDTNEMDRQNWLIYDHLPSGVSSEYQGNSFAQDKDGSYDLSGGWFDCGDHVKFGQTQYYSAYMILKAYAEFKAGFGDYYSPNYPGYGISGDWTWESNEGQPNGIPDILDEVKHATDYFIKCAKDENTFYFQVGNGNYDHTTWVTSTKMQTQPSTNGGAPRDLGKNPSDGAMPSFCAATLALMAREYEQFDPVYAEKCMKHARYAYYYASQYIGASEGAAHGSYYPGNANSKNAWGICLAEMYWSTSDSSYISELDLLSVPGDINSNDGYTFDYSNNGELALYVLAQLGKSGAQSKFNNRIETHWKASGNYNTEDVFTAGASWGKLRYPANAAFLIALYDKLNGNSLDTRVYDNVDYILGSNTAKQSFVTGFKSDPTYLTPVYPHHRNAYVNDNNVSNSTIISMPSKNEQMGALVGGSLTSSGFSDDRSNFVDNEVCIDYNAGLVGSLGAIRSEVDPIDTNLFLGACSSPDLGGDKYLCHSSTVTLNTNLSMASNRTFQWFKDDVSQGPASSALTSFSTTETGRWKVITDSAGVCQRIDEIEIHNDIPAFEFGPDLEICSTECVSLNTNVSGNELSIVWSKDGMTLSNTEPSIEIASTGQYDATVSLSGCTTQSDDISITSFLPDAIHGEFCPPASVNLEVVNTGDSFEWFDSPISTTPIATGNSFTTPVLNSEKTYYVENSDLSTNNTVGLDATTHGLTNGNFGTGNPSDKAIVFNALQDFVITGFTLEYSAPGSTESLPINLYNSLGAVIGSSSVTISSGSGTVTNTYSFTSPLSVTTGNGYILKIEGWNSTNTIIYRNSSGTNPYPYTDGSYLEVTAPHPDISGSNPYSHPAFFDIQIAVGNVCSRRSVQAIDTCSNPVASLSLTELAVGISIFPNPTQNKLHVVSEYDINEIIVSDLFGRTLLVSESSTVDMSKFNDGIYYATIVCKEGVITKRVIKE